MRAKAKFRFRAPEAILLLSIIVIPGAQLFSKVPDAVIWQVAIYLLNAAALVLFIGLPWLGAGWARRLRKKLLVSHPGALIAIVLVERDEKAHLKLMLVESAGVSFLNEWGQVELYVLQANVTEVLLLQKGFNGREILAMSLREDPATQEFTPLGAQGFEQLDSLGLSHFRALMRERLVLK